MRSHKEVTVRSSSGVNVRGQSSPGLYDLSKSKSVSDLAPRAEAPNDFQLSVGKRARVAATHFNASRRSMRSGSKFTIQTLSAFADKDRSNENSRSNVSLLQLSQEVVTRAP